MIVGMRLTAVRCLSIYACPSIEDFALAGICETVGQASERISSRANLRATNRSSACSRFGFSRQRLRKAPSGMQVLQVANTFFRWSAKFELISSAIQA